MTSAIDITAGQRRTILALLERHLPDTAVWACGSRVKGTSRPASDLDLVVFARPEQRGQVAELREAFEESNPPFPVDLFVWDEVPESFRTRIEAEHAELVNTTAGRKTQDNWLYGPLFPIHWDRRPLYSMAQWVNGLAYRNIKFSAAGRPIIKIAEIKGGISGQTKFTDQKFDESVRIRAGDLLFSWSGQPETSIDAFWWRGPEGWLNQHIFRVTPSDGIDTTFFFYLLRYLKPNFVAIARNKQTTGLGHVTKHDLENIEAAVPDIHEQHAIAHVLGTLDDRIELNRRMNETLEAMARALFQSWFVDFDPVRAKMEGRDTGLPKSIADLFPDRLVESGLGLIPDGWEAGRLADIATTPRRNVDPASLDDEIPYIGLEHMPRRSIALGAWGGVGKLTSNKSAFNKGEVLFGKLRPYFHKVGIAPTNGVCSTDIVVIASKAVEWSAFVLLCVSSAEFVGYTDQGSTGTKMPRTNWTTMGDYRMCLPAAPVARAFQKAVQPVLEQIVANVHESHTLAAQRDTLLPKLISGEIRLRDAARQMENIA